MEQQFPWRVLEDAAPTASSPPGPHRATGAHPAPADANDPGRRPLLGLVALAAGVVAIVAAAAVVLGGLTAPALVLSGNGGSPLELSRARADGTPATSSAPAPAADGGRIGGTEAGTLVVDVAGAVRRPGVYRFAAGARVADAVAAAGGFGPRVDAEAASRVNLAAELRDGEQVRIPSRDDTAAAAPARAPGSAPVPGGTGGVAAAPPGLVDVNTASAEALDALPGIGPVTSAKIIAAREEAPFAAVEELRTRGVLGEATFAKVRDLVTAGP